MKHQIVAVAKRTPLRYFYRYFANLYRSHRLRRKFREWTEEDEARLVFYRQFIASGDIAFDVGANMGNRAKVFHRLGAVVIAVEPQAQCANFLQSVFSDEANFHLVRKALGSSPGETEMLISNASTISSLSSDWIRAVKDSGRFNNHTWNRKERILVDTLDNLIAEFGKPTFVKIDVEGFEEQVIAGLSTPIDTLSMEFTPEFMESTYRCIERLCSIGDPRFRISLGESLQFANPEWVTADEIRKDLSAVPPMAFGDLYARFGP